MQRNFPNYSHPQVSARNIDICPKISIPGLKMSISGPKISISAPPPIIASRGGGGASCGHMMVTKWSLGGQNHKIMISVLGRSILVNGILYIRLFSPLDITSSKYRNGEFNFVSCSNLRRSLGIMYNMLIHGPTHFWPL